MVQNSQQLAKAMPRAKYKLIQAPLPSLSCQIWLVWSIPTATQESAGPRPRSLDFQTGLRTHPT